MISGTEALEILNKPDSGIVGLKWQETRKTFGKEASEIRWITDAVENESYCTHAESHGSIYATKLALAETDEKANLSFQFISAFGFQRTSDSVDNRATN